MSLTLTRCGHRHSRCTCREQVTPPLVVVRSLSLPPKSGTICHHRSYLFRHCLRSASTQDRALQTFFRRTLTRDMPEVFSRTKRHAKFAPYIHDDDDDDDWV